MRLARLCGSRYLHLYVGGLAVTAALVGLVAITGGPLPSWAPLALLGLAGASAERAALRFSDRVEVSITLAPVLFAAVAFGPQGGFIVGAVAMLVDLRPPYLKWLVYTCSRGLAGAAAGATAELVGGLDPERLLASAALATCVAAVAAQAVDLAITTTTVLIRSGERRFDALRLLPAIALSTAIYAPAIALLVVAYHRLTPWSLVLFLVPALAAQRLFVLYQGSQRLVRQLDEASSAFATALVTALEARDRYTAGHSTAVAEAAAATAAELGLAGDEQLDAYRAGLLHDVGKVAISPTILEKPGHLSDAEWAEMEKHPAVGERILASAEQYRGIATIVRHHHERYDGGGYPDQLAGDAIPMISRIVAVTDAFHAMTSVRPYRGAMTEAQAIEELRRESGRQFDPAVVAAFVQVVYAGRLRAGARTSAAEASFAAEPRAPSLRVRHPAAPFVSAGAHRDDTYARLADVFHELLAEHDVDEILNRVADSFAELVPYSTLTVYELDASARRLVPTLVRDRWGAEVLDHPIAVGEGITGWVAEHREAVCTEEAGSDPRAGVIPGTPVDQPEALMSIPLVARETVKGVLNLYREGSGAAFTAAEFDLARRFADAVALALDNAALRTDLEHRATTDSLTGLFNHRAFYEALAGELRRGSATRKRVCVLMIDIDDFKEINDHYGHGVGDLVIKGVADVLRDVTRDGDILCRIGGEELAVVMPACDVTGALSCAARLHVELAGRPQIEGRQITVSAGIATSAVTTDVSELARLADDALRQAKQAGKNRTIVHDVTSSPARPGDARYAAGSPARPLAGS